MPAGRRWQDLGLSVSFRACDLRGLEPVGEALRTAASPDEAVLSPIDVSHLDLAENELEDVDGLVAFDSLVSLDLAHNNVSVMPSGLGSSLLHLNLGYNRLEHVGAVSSLISLVELNLGYNLLTSLAPLEPLVQLQVPPTRAI
jgi:Leucine-rich repeat (LRR) protein